MKSSLGMIKRNFGSSKQLRRMGTRQQIPMKVMNSISIRHEQYETAASVDSHTSGLRDGETVMETETDRRLLLNACQMANYPVRHSHLTGR